MTISLKKDIQIAFPFGKKDMGYDILLLIGKNGSMVKFAIERHLAAGTTKRVNSIIDNFLIPHGYVFGVQSKTTRRNVKNAFGKGIEIKPTKYYLTTKGVIASLSKISLKDNYVFKRYLALFSDSLQNDVTEYIKYEISLQIHFSNMQESNLHTIKDIVYHVEDASLNWNSINLDKKTMKKMYALENSQNKIYKKIKNEETYFLLNEWIKVLKILTKHSFTKEKILKKLKFVKGQPTLHNTDFNNILKDSQTPEDMFVQRMMDEHAEREKRILIIKKKREKELGMKSKF